MNLLLFVLYPPHISYNAAFLLLQWVEWPFKWIYKEFIEELFDSEWESRHGACMALKAILKKHGSGCGKVRGMTSEQVTMLLFDLLIFNLVWFLGTKVIKSSFYVLVYGRILVFFLTICALCVQKYKFCFMEYTAHTN